jgi:hypothetical protein
LGSSFGLPCSEHCNQFPLAQPFAAAHTAGMSNAEVFGINAPVLLLVFSAFTVVGIVVAVVLVSMKNRREE